MPKERDPLHKYVQDLEKRKWRCTFCNKEFAGSTPRIRWHLAGITGHNIRACEKVDDAVRAEALRVIEGRGSVLDTSTVVGTSGEGTEGTVVGTTQSVLPSDDASNRLGCAPQQTSFDPPTGTGTAPACPQDQGPLRPGDMPLVNVDPIQQRENASSIPQHLMDLFASSSIEFSDLLEFSEQSSHLEFRDASTPDAPPDSDQSILHDFLPENLRESVANFFEDIEADELHNPEEVDGANRLQGCGQPLGVEEVPVPSNRSPTNIVQQSGQLPPRCDKEDGNDIRWFPSPTRMQIDPSSASLNTSDSRILEATMVDSLVVEASTDTVGPSSSHALVPPSSSQAPHNAPLSPQILPCGIGLIGPSSLPELDMNEGAPMTSHPNTEDNFEENRALKRKLKLLYSKRVKIRDELEFAASLSLKKPRMEVVNWLANVEKLRNDCPEAAKEDCLPPHQQVDILMHEVEDLMRQGKGLFEVRETKVNKLLEDEMVGEAFQRNTTKILGHLVGNQISRLGIYGMGGVGKTTIMVHIHNRLLEEANYGNVLWITVSQDFNTESLQDAIWKELGLGILQEKDVRRRAAMLCDCLMKRGKSTIIFDDVWERFDLKEVGIPVRADGIKLVLTTRSIEVCRHMQCQEMIKIEPLSHKEAESLFWEELKLEVALTLETKIIVKSIVKECAGLPLAIITMATSMRGVTDVFEWKDCLKKLRESDMGQTDMEKVVLKRLEFNYNRLGKHEVQQCFLSCALYPEDKLIDKFELIEFFIDQGLFGQLETREEQYCRGRTILNKLANVCLLEDHGSVMKMHDLIRDMALHVMSAISIVKAGKGLKRIPYEEYWTDALEKVSLMENDIREFPLNMSPNCSKLSTFLLNKSLCDVVIPDSFFKQLWGLKVLNLSGCKLSELPNSISDLVHLTVLSLGFCRELRCIPYLGKLRYLRKLDVFSCVKLEAIKGLEMLVNLTFLDIAYTRIKRLPKGTLEALLKLQYLKVQAVNEEDIIKLWALETIDCQFEDVDDFNKLVRVVSKQENNPRYYKLNICQERLGSFWDLSGETRFGNRERSVHIEKRSNAIVSAGGESNGGGICILIPQDVQKLTSSNCDGATNLSDIGPLENLEELEIGKWEDLRVLCRGQDEIINTHDSPAPTPTPTPLPFPSLRVLKIYQCPKLKYLFGHGPIFSLPHLREIKINECKEMVGIIVAVTSPPPHQPPAFPSLEYISVFECNKIKRVVESEGLPCFPNLRKIDVCACENMEEIIGGPSPYVPVEEISLEWLHVHGCHNMRKLFPHELLLHFQNLQKIQVSDCKGMVEILSGARQGQEGSIMTPVNKTLSSFQSSISLPKLYSLTLHNLPQLKSICGVPITCYSLEYLEVLHGGQDEIINIHDSPAPTPAPPLFQSLRELSLSNCPKLKYLFGHGPKFFLPHLQDIRIDECEEMVGIISPSPQPPSAFPSLEVITIRKCDKMKRAVESEWLPHCPNLREIALIYCKNMEEIFGGPPPYVSVEISLEWLWVEECHNMRKLFPHEWMLHLQNLRTIDVTRCKGMVKMISRVGQGQEGSITTPVNDTPSFSQSSISLPKLNCLFLRNLPQLKSICEVPITCDSMEGLVVSECPELNRIPLQLRLRDIKDLPYIEVEGEEKWKTLIWDHPNAQTILQSHLRFDGARFILEGQGVSKSSAKWVRISPVLMLKMFEERPSDAILVTRARFPANSQVAI